MPKNVLGRCPDDATPDVICASGPAQFGWEGAVPGYMPAELIHKDDEMNKPYVMMEVEMDVSLQETLDRVVEKGGKIIDSKGEAGNRLLLWRCPDSRTWEEPETDYDKE